MKAAKGLKKLKTLNGWKQLFEILDKKEKILFSSFLALFLGSTLWLLGNLYIKNTKRVPAFGGSFIEGVIGHPRFVNPVYAILSDVDRDLTQLVFAGLMKYDKEGKLVPELAKEYKILEEGKVFEVSLKDDLLWQDGEKLTIDDLIFTIEIIQNPDFKSPLRAAWVGVGLEKISDKTLRFKLREPSAIFLENLTLEILPRHIWQNIPAQNFPFSIYNLRPIGSGPYQIEKIEQNNSGYIKTLTLLPNPKYKEGKPKIEKITFRFFDKEGNLIKAAKRGEIQGFSIMNPKNYGYFKGKRFKNHIFTLPRYFTVFFNPEKSEILADKKVREALNYGTDKEEIIKLALFGKGKIANSPILPEVYGFKAPSKIYEFNQNKAEEILEEAGFIKNESGLREKAVKEKTAFQFKGEIKTGSRGNEVAELQKCLAKDPQVYPEGEITSFFGQQTKEAVIRFQEKYAKEILEPQGIQKGNGVIKKSTRDKLNELCAQSPKKTMPLKITLTVSQQELLEKVAQLLKKQWEKLGAEVTIELFDISGNKREIIKQRDYQAILFGEVLLSTPDPLPFWHSIQKRDPGSNLALYENREADKILEETRKIFNPELRAQKLESFQEILIADAPAVFLFTQDYLYFTSKEIKGITEHMIIDPSKRFSNIENWHIKTRRVFK